MRVPPEVLEATKQFLPESPEGGTAPVVTWMLARRGPFWASKLQSYAMLHSQCHKPTDSWSTFQQQLEAHTLMAFL